MGSRRISKKNQVLGSVREFTGDGAFAVQAAKDRSTSGQRIGAISELITQSRAKSCMFNIHSDAGDAIHPGRLLSGYGWGISSTVPIARATAAGVSMKAASCSTGLVF